MYVLGFRFPASFREIERQETGKERTEANGDEGDVGGQKTLRSYWRNYFEKTDALVWVVDATDRGRVGDCREELHGLLLEEVSFPCTPLGSLPACFSLFSFSFSFFFFACAVPPTVVALFPSCSNPASWAEVLDGLEVRC